MSVFERVHKIKKLFVLQGQHAIISFNFDSTYRRLWQYGSPSESRWYLPSRLLDQYKHLKRYSFQSNATSIDTFKKNKHTLLPPHTATKGPFPVGLSMCGKSVVGGGRYCPLSGRLASAAGLTCETGAVVAICSDWIRTRSHWPGAATVSKYIHVQIFKHNTIICKW